MNHLPPSSFSQNRDTLSRIQTNTNDIAMCLVCVKRSNERAAGAFDICSSSEDPSIFGNSYPRVPLQKAYSDGGINELNGLEIITIKANGKEMERNQDRSVRGLAYEL